VQAFWPSLNAGTREGNLKIAKQIIGGVDITIRPIRPEDAGIEEAFIRELSPESRRRRFLAAVREVTPKAIDRFTRPEYPHEQALIATIEVEGAEKEIGVARFAGEPGGREAEFAIVVADAWQGRGLGALLMRELIDVASAAGICRLEGQVLRDNTQMLKMVRELGFHSRNHPEDPRLVQVQIELPTPMG